MNKNTPSTQEISTILALGEEEGTKTKYFISYDSMYQNFIIFYG